MRSWLRVIVNQSSGKMVSELINANPIVYEKKERRAWSMPTAVEEYAVEPIDQQEVFDILSLQLFWYGLCTFKSTYYRGISKVVFRELGLDGHNFFFFCFLSCIELTLGISSSTFDMEMKWKK